MSATDWLRLANGLAQSMAVPRRAKPHTPGFYLPPDPLPATAPGEIIRAEPMHAYVVPGVRMKAEAWRVLYRSTGALGEPTAVSGTVLIPAGARDVRPLVGFAVGTHGIGDAAAPSRLLSRGLDWEASMIAMVLARGWAVAITDYQGLGTPGDHTYMVGRTLGHNVLDAMRAARAINPRILPGDGPAAVIGYSEGGAAAAWAAQLQPLYAPELVLAGVAAGAAAADLETGASSLDGTFFSFFVAYGGIGYAAAYPELDLDAHLTDRARERIGELRNSTVLEAALRGPHFSGPGDFTNPNVFELPEWRARMRENRIGDIKPDAPVLLHHAKRDHIVHFSQSLDLRDDWLALGGDVRLYVTKGGVDHLSGALAGTPVALDWLAKRIARAQGRRATPAPARPLSLVTVDERAAAA